MNGDHAVAAPTRIPPWAILHVPHASTLIPVEVRDQFLLDDESLHGELARLTDHLTDRLFGDGWPTDQIVQSSVSRLVVDVERFDDDDREPMAGKGLGVIYTRASDGRHLRNAVTNELRESLLDRWYRPHHQDLSARVMTAIKQYRRALIIDAHSYPLAPLPYEDPSFARPQICIGTDPFHTPSAMVDALLAIFQAHGFSVGINTPFKGTMVPVTHYKTDPRCQSVMIEVRRDTYCDDQGDASKKPFAIVKAAIKAAVEAAFSVETA